ncbi:AAA family ATPase [Vreelandella venusta]|uniref:AAA family ATPase n=1 Tax=Vreelandella venusta TaxID=44935 RepID=UPI0018DA403C|nr:AAA family ATPase [Halomonas venusta]QPI62864.1 AAA family ATPase [Halomonas venusta]
MIRTEYLNFLQNLNEAGVSSDIRKLANLILVNQDELVPLGTHQGARVRRLVALAQASWDTLNEDIKPLSEQPEEQMAAVTQLKSMVVGPFRGFARQETFDLASRLVLIYGPNGTGKSSFCEALEYGLLGNVAEAESKRFRDQHEYLKNAYVKLFTAPVIVGLNEQGEEVEIQASEELYRFCFVEKNRIDSFSRIAAQAPAKQTGLISTLFGLDSFNEFVRNFTAEIDARYIDLTGVKASELARKRQALSGSEQQISINENELQKLDVEERELADQYREGATFNQMVFELNGDEHHAGTIQQLEHELQQHQENKSNLTTHELDNIVNSIGLGFDELDVKQEELQRNNKELSFQKLYNAVVKLKESSSENCPACKTPLNQVAVNPYTHADEELKKLQHLASLQKAIEQKQQDITNWLLSLSQIATTCLRLLPQENILHTMRIPSDTQATIEWWSLLNQQLQDGFTTLQHIQSQVNQLEQADLVIEQADKVRSTKQAEYNRLRRLENKITVLQTRRHTAQQAITSAKQTITNFDTENSKLIADVDVERTLVEKNNAIAASYRSLIAKLNAYKNRRPGQLVANLGEIVVTLYNAFNRNDSKSELLSMVKLPLAQNQQLGISFQNNPQKVYDALHVLSEGHIRCVGLAILLAKNLKENCPLLIFDDPVNAIDEDHRESIRRTLFEDHYFSDKQILLTCHGEEFFKDIHNLLPAQSAAQSQSLAFLPRLDEPHIRVDFNCAPRNYIIAARSHFERNEIRDALTKSRKALESLTKVKVWRYVNKYGDGSLSLKLRSSKAPIELRNLTEQLNKKIGKSDFSDLNKESVYNPLEILLGLNGDSREWRYLNKGAHEEDDRSEFDRHSVSVIISALESIDQAL